MWLWKALADDFVISLSCVSFNLKTLPFPSLCLSQCFPSPCIVNMSTWDSWEYWLNVGFFSVSESVSLITSKCLSKMQHFMKVSQGKECGVVRLPRISPSLPAQRLASKLEQSLCSWWDRVASRETFSWLLWNGSCSPTQRQQVGKWLWKLPFSLAARILLCLHVVLWGVGGEACFGLCFVSLKLWKGVSPAAA